MSDCMTLEYYHLHRSPEEWAICILALSPRPILFRDRSPHSYRDLHARHQQSAPSGL